MLWQRRRRWLRWHDGCCGAPHRNISVPTLPHSSTVSTVPCPASWTSRPSTKAPMLSTSPLHKHASSPHCPVAYRCRQPAATCAYSRALHSLHRSSFIPSPVRCFAVTQVHVPARPPPRGLLPHAGLQDAGGARAGGGKVQRPGHKVRGVGEGKVPWPGVEGEVVGTGHGGGGGRGEARG